MSVLHSRTLHSTSSKFLPVIAPTMMSIANSQVTKGKESIKESREGVEEGGKGEITGRTP